VEFFDDDKLITYSSIIPNQKDDFQLDGDLVLSAQERIFSKNMAERYDLKGSEVINSIFSALIINRKSKVFRDRVMLLAKADREKKGCITYVGFRFFSDNYRKLKDMIDLIREVAPIPTKSPPSGLRWLFGEGKEPVNMEMSVAIDVVLALFELEAKEE